jgi:uncharacterized protein (TIGR01244 family)
MMSTQDIYNYLKVNDELITSGQPTAEQLKAAADEGFTAIINLVPSENQSALAGEAAIVQALGLKYVHVPVDWAAPQDSDFAAFEQAMQAVPDDRTLIHCAANFRVTAFYSLYAMKHLDWTAAQASEFRNTIWQGSDYPVWESFIERLQSQILRT